MNRKSFLAIILGLFATILIIIFFTIWPKERPYFNSLVASAAKEGCFDLTVGEVRVFLKDEMMKKGEGKVFKFTSPSGGITVHVDGESLTLTGLQPGEWPLVVSNLAGADTMYIRVVSDYPPTGMPPEIEF